MTTTCPKCAYVRQPTDTAPDYECPQCGIIYAKFRPSEPASSTRKAEIKTERTSRSPIVLILLWSLLAVLLAGGSAYAYMWKQEHDEIAATRASLAQLDAVSTRFRQALQLAGSTSRIALATPVKDLQAISNEVKAQVPVGCAASAHKALTLATEAAVEGFLAFMRGGADEDDSARALRLAADQIGTYREKSRLCEQRLGGA